MKRMLGGASGQFMLIHVDGTLASARNDKRGVSHPQCARAAVSVAGLDGAGGAAWRPSLERDRFDATKLAVTEELMKGVEAPSE